MILRRLLEVISEFTVPYLSHFNSSFCSFFCSSSTIPHGKFSILTLIISIAAYVCAVHTAYSCQFVTVPIGDLGFYSSQEIKFGLGLWSYEDILGDNSFSCIEWNDSADSDILDATWIAARWLALCANVCIGIAIISCIVMTCIPLPVAIIKCLVFGLLCLGFFFESLVFIAFSSDVCSNINCQFSAGAGTAVAALILAMIAAAFAFKIPPCEPGNFTPGAPFLDEGLVGGPGTVKVQTTLEPDGTKKTVTTTVNADGSCTVSI